MLLVSPQEMRATADGEFHAGEGTVAILGRYDPATHAFARQSVQAIDYGLDFYAPQTTLAPDGRRIMVAWMQSWATAPGAPCAGGRPWFGRMTLPRELRVQNGRLYQTPVREIETLWHDKVELTGVTVEGDAALPGIGGRSLDLTVRVDAAASPACRRFTLRFAAGGARCTTRSAATLTAASWPLTAATAAAAATAPTPGTSRPRPKTAC